MNTLVKHSVSDHSRFHALSHTKNVLFVAPSTCGQLQMVKYFWDFYGPEDFEASFAALENNPINPWLSAAMHDYDFTIRQSQVHSIFVLSATANKFGYIVSLGGFQNYSSISPFLETLDILFGKSPKRVCWDIPDPENCSGSRTDQTLHAIDIRNRIEFEVAQLAQSFEELSLEEN